MAAEAKKSKKHVIVTTYSFKDVTLEIDDTKYEIIEVKQKKEYVKTIFTKKNYADKAISIPYRKMKKETVADKIPIKFLKTKLKVNNISFFLEVLDDGNANDYEDILATFEIGAKRKGWITRDYQQMTVIGRPINSQSEQDHVEWSFEYPLKGGKLLTRTQQIK